MKKITCMAMMAAMLLLAIPAQAQFSWGIKGGVNLGGNDLTMLTNKKSAFDATNYTGFFIGPKAEVRIPDRPRHLQAEQHTDSAEHQVQPRTGQRRQLLHRCRTRVWL